LHLNKYPILFLYDISAAAFIINRAAVLNFKQAAVKYLATKTAALLDAHTYRLHQHQSLASRWERTTA